MWINLLEQYNKPDLENINNFFLLRNLYKKYNHLIDSLDKDRDDENKKICKEDINKYYLIDEFAFILDNNIKNLLEIHNDELANDEKIAIFIKYNPYYNIKEKDDNIRYKKF